MKPKPRVEYSNLLTNNTKINKKHLNLSTESGGSIHDLIGKSLTLVW